MLMFMVSSKQALFAVNSYSDTYLHKIKKKHLLMIGIYSMIKESWLLRKLMDTYIEVEPEIEV